MGDVQPALKVIDPLEGGALAIALLQRLNTLLFESKCAVQAAADDPNDESIRPIQGKRYEVFIQASGKPASFFLSLCEKLAYAEEDNSSSEQTEASRGSAISTTIIEYCTEAAHQDSRTDGLQFGNFSLLLNYEPVEDQEPHIDMLVPNHQFGCIVTNGTPGTKVFSAPNAISTPEDWRAAYPEITKSFVAAISENKRASKLLKGFGNVLCRDLREISSGESLQTGTLLSLPGSALHAGPACPDFRAIIFFSGWPPHSKSVTEYHPDTQYFSGLLICDLLSEVWSGLERSDRRALLRHLVANMMSQKHPRHLARHLCPGYLRDFCDEAAEAEDPDHLKRLIRGTSRYKTLDETERIQKASVDGLWTTCDGEECRIRVFWRPTPGTVCFQYVDTPEVWEGAGDAPYQLVLKEGAELFDGSNGTLSCNEGQEIPCFLKDARKRMNATPSS